MQKECALGAQRGSYAGVPTGFRRLTPSLLAADRTAASFDGLPDSVTMHGQLLAACKAAAPRLTATTWNPTTKCGWPSRAPWAR